MIYLKNIFSIKLLILLFAVLGLIVSSCETTDLNLQDSPNSLIPSQSDPDFYYNDVQLEIARLFEGFTNAGARLTRIEQFNNSDYITYDPGFSTNHSRAYATILSDLRSMKPLAEAKGLKMHIAMADVLEAYMMMTLVDYYGDMPYSEAALGAEHLNPNLDSGASIYNAVEDLLDASIVAFDNFNASTDILPSVDLYYNGDVLKWRRFANTLRFKLYLQKRLLDDGTYAAKINDILSQGVISSAAEDFQFNYSTVDQNPDSRHPRFAGNYDTGVNSYQSNYLMNEMVNGKPVMDPRTRYYFYRQSDSPGNDSEMPCGAQAAPSHYGSNDAFCFITGGWLGRDHGNSQPIPPDDAIRTNYGLYPIGGRFDDDSFAITNSRDQGAKGAGISPIMLSSYVKFMEAESALELGTTGNPRTLLEEAVRSSIDKVINFNTDPNIVNPTFVPPLGQIDAYVNAVLADYDAASNKLDVIMREYFIALKGNGIEAYNSYRRTGFPSDLQPTLSSSPGAFMRSFYYPSNMINSNINISQKNDQTIQVFWDTNPSNFID